MEVKWGGIWTCLVRFGQFNGSDECGAGDKCGVGEVRGMSRVWGGGGVPGEVQAVGVVRVVGGEGECDAGECAEL